MHLRPTVPALREADALATREPPSAVPLATVLERSRALLVRGNARDALATLDDAWEGAMRTESGWYLRSAALTLLGPPEDAERVLHNALVPYGGSVALLFLQSVVRSSLGDASGARESLRGAAARRPAEPALIVWRAVLTAREGDRGGALQQLREIPVVQGQSALLDWARQSITSTDANASRAVNRMGWDVHSGKARAMSDSAPAVEFQAPLPGTGRPLDTLVTPICVGLTLLQQPSSGAVAHQVATQHRQCVPAPTPPTGTQSSPSDAAVAAQLQAAAFGRATAVRLVAGSERDQGRGAGDKGSSSLAVSFKSGQRMRVLALVCMALAFAAMVYGQGIAAIALAGGASWLALRSSSVSAAARSREYGTPDESPR